MSSTFFAAARRWLVAGLLALVVCPRAPAQTDPPERWLFIFDTSFPMKKRLPNVAAEIKNLLASDISGQLHAGDSVGVWTFDRELRAGKFPLLDWDSSRAAATASNLVAFLQKQSYAGETSFAALQPVLGQVIKDSARLTVIVFCDGQGTVDWTPYNDGINQTFKQGQAERQKARQPFVLLVRTQRGQFTGCTVNFPPGALNVPPFPPLPEPVKTVPANPPPAVVRPPPVVVPPLIIVGTNVGTNLNSLPRISPPAVAAPPAAPMNSVDGTNHPAPAALNLPAAPPAEIKTNLPASAAGAPTNVLRAAPPGGPDNRPDPGARSLTWAGAGLGAAVALLIYLWARVSRRPRSSLITSSMQSDPRPPRK